MPIRESRCKNPDCPNFDRVREWFAKTQEDPDPECTCGHTMHRLMSTFAVVFTGPITARYNDATKEGAHEEGHWAFPRRREDGTVPNPVRIETFEEQRRFCRENNFALPSESPTNTEISDDGKKLQSAGMPGSWV